MLVALSLITAGAMMSLASLITMQKMPTKTHGLYWDDGRTWTLENWPRLVQLLKKMGVDYIVVNTNGSEAARAGRASGRWSAAQLSKLMVQGGPDVHAMAWASPTRAFADDFDKYCASLRAHGIRVVELDVERDAWGLPSTGFSSHREAAKSLLKIARSHGLTIGVTMIPSRMYAEFAGADYVAAQAYSKYKGGAANHAPGGAYGPGNMQRRAYRAAKNLGVPLVQALAAYDQKWPELKRLDGMTIAYKQARNSSNSIRYWSSKWVVGSRADATVAHHIQTLIRNEV